MALATSLITGLINTTSYVSPRLAGKAAFQLFTNPLSRAAVRSAERQVHADATVTTVDVDGTGVQTYQWGEGGLPVLLIHGFQARASCYASLVPALRAAGLTVVAYDAPGHGDSKGDHATVLDHRALIGQLQELHGPFHAIIGHSFGALCAFYAVRSGVKAGRIVAISGPSDFGSLPDMFCEQLALRDVVRQDLRRRTEEYFLPMTGIWETFSPTHQPDDITVPILVVHDPADREVPAEHSHRIAAAYPSSATLHVTDGLGHRRILRDDAVTATVLAFLSAEPPAS